MSTPSRIEIDRAVSQLSTGPRTVAAKKYLPLNALRHGLTGQIVVMPADDLAAYQSHVKSFTDEYQPQGATEAHLVQALADTAWRLNRAASLEANLLSLGIMGVSPAAGAPSEVCDAMAIAASLESQSKALATLSMHTQRLSRQFERTVAQLRDLQQARQAEAKQELDTLVDILEMQESTGKTYDPAPDGFVFSETQINAAIRARNRERLALKAHSHRHQTAAA